MEIGLRQVFDFPEGIFPTPGTVQGRLYLQIRRPFGAPQPLHDRILFRAFPKERCQDLPEKRCQLFINFSAVQGSLYIQVTRRHKGPDLPRRIPGQLPAEEGNLGARPYVDAHGILRSASRRVNAGLVVPHGPADRYPAVAARYRALPVCPAGYRQRIIRGIHPRLLQIVLRKRQPLQGKTAEAGRHGAVRPSPCHAAQPHGQIIADADKGFGRRHDFALLL